MACQKLKKNPPFSSRLLDIQTARSNLDRCPSYPPVGQLNTTSFPLRFHCLPPMAQEMRPSVSTCPAALSWFQSASNFIGSQFSRSDSIITRPTTEEFPAISLLSTFTFAFLIFMWSNSSCPILALVLGNLYFSFFIIFLVGGYFLFAFFIFLLQTNFPLFVFSFLLFINHFVTPFCLTFLRISFSFFKRTGE